MSRTSWIALCGMLLAGCFLFAGTPAVCAQESGAASLEGAPVTAVVVRGLEHVDDDVVLRRMDTRVGAPWRPEIARRDERAITALGIFWSVRVHPEPVEDGVRVLVDLEERFPLFLLPEVTWTAEEGWSYGVTAGYLNVARRAHRVFLTARTGGARFLSLSLSNPWNGGAHQSFHIGGALVRSSNRLYAFKESGERLNAQLGRWTGREGHGRVFAGLDYRHVVADRPGITRPGTTSDRYHAAWLYLGLDTTDPWAFPRLGGTAWVRIEGSGGPLGGEVSGLDLRGALQQYRRLGGRWVVAGRLLGERQTGDRPYWRLRDVGGPASLRGYPLGEWLVEERWETTLELQWYVVPMHVEELGPLGQQIVGISLALFGDAGRGRGVRRGPGSGPWGEETPLMGSWGVSARFHNALFGTLRLETAWSDHGDRQFFVALGDPF